MMADRPEFLVRGGEGYFLVKSSATPKAAAAPADGENQILFLEPRRR
jgi:hypothetical protein